MIKVVVPALILCVLDLRGGTCAPLKGKNCKAISKVGWRLLADTLQQNWSAADFDKLAELAVDKPIPTLLNQQGPFKIKAQRTRQNRMAPYPGVRRDSKGEIPDRNGSHNYSDAKLNAMELRAEIEKAFNRLSPTVQRVVRLKYIQGRTIEQISLLLEMPLGTAKSTLSRGLMILRQNSILAKYFTDLNDRPSR